MRKFLDRTAAALLAAVLFVPKPVLALSAQSAILMDAVSGRVMFDKCSDRKSLIASTTKIMTALLICERCNVLDQMRIPKAAVGIEGSSMYLVEGERLSLQELLYGLMLSSGNDAAIALALYCSGSVEEFANQMNDKARVLGMTQSHFVNPHGLDAQEHYSTARDLAILASYAMENPIFAKTVSTKSVQIGNRFLRNHNKLLWRYNGADGVKTGFTRSAGRILVSSASRDNRRLVAVTINAPNDWQDHTKLLNDGFAEFEMKPIVASGDLIGYREIAGGKSGKVPVIAAESFSYPVSDDDCPQTMLPGTGFVYAPVVAEADAGYAYVLVSGKAVGRVRVVYGETDEIHDTETPRRWRFWR